VSLQARFYGIPLHGIKYWKERFKDRIAGRVRFPVFDLSDPKLSQIVAEFRKIPFVYINGYTSSLVVFAKYLIKKGLVLNEVCPSLRLSMPTSEVCDDLDRAVLIQGFGVPVFNEILDNQNRPVPNGQEGRVIVTSLYNKAMPFIRYELGDRAIISPTLKNGRRVLEKVVGRVNDIIQLPSGKISPGLTFYYVSKRLLESGGRIKEFVIRQKALDVFKFQYVSEIALTEEEKDMCRKATEEYLEPGLHIEFERVEFIERTKAGKLKHFFSEI
jgi:phenylacetate-CoA ligase